MEYLMPPNRPYNVVSKKPPVQEQLDTIWNYLTETQQVMNRNMQLFTPQALSRQIVNIVDKADKFNPHSAKVPYDKRVYAALKSNIIKTADIIVRDSQTFSQTLASSEAFQSEFGKLLSVATLQIDGSAVGIRQLYTWHETLKSDYGNYVTNSQQYIKDGLLDYDGASPIYGIEVGLISEKIKYIDENGKEVTVSVKNPIKTRITASEWSLWRNDTKICYTNANNIYFPSAHITGGSIAIGSHFTVTNSGNLTATSGKIGGWTIDSSKIYCGDGTNGKCVGLLSQAYSPTYAIVAGCDGISDYTSAKFRVTHEGVLYAKGATISGEITATSGTIAKWTISDDRISSTGSGDSRFFLSSGDSSIHWMSAYNTDGSLTFRVSKEGVLYAKDAEITGKITATSGSFTGSIHASSGDIGGWKITSATLEKTHEDGALFYLAGSNSYDNWMVAKDSSGSITFRVHRDGTLHATGAVISGKITATSGTIGGWTINSNRLQGGTASDSTCVLVNASNYSSYAFAAGSSSASSFGAAPFRVSHAGKLYATNAEIKGKITATSGKIAGWTISGNVLTAGDASKEQEVVIDPDYLIAHGDEAYWWDVVMCTQAYTETYSSESDLNVKNSISAYDERYEKLFDNLKPCKYKYNHGTSDRYHTGFIAQQIVDALEKAGLTTQDFAGVIQLKKPNKNGCEWLLRRDEFVSLNTWQIQKLKEKIAELEAEIIALKSN